MAPHEGVSTRVGHLSIHTLFVSPGGSDPFRFRRKRASAVAPKLSKGGHFLSFLTLKTTHDTLAALTHVVRFVLCAHFVHLSNYRPPCRVSFFHLDLLGTRFMGPPHHLLSKLQRKRKKALSLLLVNPMPSRSFAVGCRSKRERN